MGSKQSAEATEQLAPSGTPTCSQIFGGVGSRRVNDAKPPAQASAAGPDAERGAPTGEGAGGGGAGATPSSASSSKVEATKPLPPDFRSIDDEAWRKLQGRFAPTQKVTKDLAAVSGEEKTDEVNGGQAVPTAVPDVEPTKVRTLDQQMSLKATDDDRTDISKKISWILRHGAKKVNVEIDPDGWVPLQALLTSDILASVDGMTETRLMEVISASNQQKMRYELKEEGGTAMIRAVSKGRRRERREDRERDRERRRDRRDEDGGDKSRDRDRAGSRERDRDRRDDRDRDRGDRDRDREDRDRGGVRDRDVKTESRDRDSRRGGKGDSGSQWWDQAARDRPLTFEQQLQAGFRPVYEGERILAMVRGDETVRPGRKGGDQAPTASTGQVGQFDQRIGKGPQVDEARDPSANSKGQGKDGKGVKGKDRKGYKGDHVDDGSAATGAEGGKGGKDFSRYGNPKAAGATESQRSNQKRWRVSNGLEAIVRASDDVESQHVATLTAGSVVVQIGDEKVMSNGIVRMLVESVRPQVGIRGWVTRTAEAAKGPIFFRPDRAPQGGESGAGGKGAGGGGYGRRRQGGD